MTVTQRRRRDYIAKSRTSADKKVTKSDKRDKVKNWCNVQDEILSVLKRTQETGATASSAVQVSMISDGSRARYPIAEHN